MKRFRFEVLLCQIKNINMNVHIRYQKTIVIGAIHTAVAAVNVRKSQYVTMFVRIIRQSAVQVVVFGGENYV